MCEAVVFVSYIERDSLSLNLFRSHTFVLCMHLHEIF